MTGYDSFGKRLFEIFDRVMLMQRAKRRRRAATPAKPPKNRATVPGSGVGDSRLAEVTVSVSTHVPKPHTPFQWAAMDALGEVARKQSILRDTARGHRAVKLKTHEANASVLEGIYARGDRPLSRFRIIRIG